MKRALTLFLFLTAFVYRSYSQIDIALVDVFPMEYQMPGTHSFDLALQVTGPTGVGYFNVSWQLNNGPVQTVQKGPGTGMGGHVTDPAFTVSFPAAGTYTLKVWVKSITVPDNNPLNDTVAKTVRVLSSLPKKNIVLEVFKHFICCPCYDAASYEDTFISHNSTYAIANIYSVSTDAVYNADGETVNNIYNAGHPEPLLDRYKFAYLPDVSTSFYTNANNQYALEGYGEREQYYEPVKVSFKSVAYTASTRQIKVKLHAQFFDDLNGDHRFNIYLTEDSILAYQACAPSPNNYYHMFVLREMMGGPWGQQGSLPVVIHNNDQLEYEFTYTIPAAYNTSNLRLIGFVQAYDTAIFKRRILNSEQISFNNALALSAEHITGMPDNIKVYPNPTTGRVMIHYQNKNSQLYTITILDMAGRQVFTTQKNADTEINIGSLTVGNYIIKIDNGAQLYSDLIRKE